jgi:hypothetical protein
MGVPTWHRFAVGPAFPGVVGFFATAQGLEDRVRELVESDPDGANAARVGLRERRVFAAGVKHRGAGEHSASVSS